MRQWRHLLPLPDTTWRHPDMPSIRRQRQGKPCATNEVGENNLTIKSQQYDRLLHGYNYESLQQTSRGKLQLTCCLRWMVLRRSKKATIEDRKRSGGLRWAAGELIASRDATPWSRPARHLVSERRKTPSVSIVGTTQRGGARGWGLEGQGDRMR